MKWKNKEIVIVDFSGIYKQESFHQGMQIKWVDLQELSGTNCYCDEESIKIVNSQINTLSAEGIHFIDSGNYHYMSRLWIAKIKEPFRLLVFDNHTDMQPPAFGGILSCGGWIAASLDEIPMLKEVILVGPSQEDFEKIEKKYKNRVIFFSKEELEESKQDSIGKFLEELPLDLPIYISIDKDILCKNDADTGWSQGSLELSVFIEYLKKIFVSIHNQNGILLGIDVCGESDRNHQEGNKKNDKANKEILNLIYRFEKK